MYNNQVPPCMMWGQMPMMNMPINPMDMEDKDLEMLYPKAYFKLIPMVKVHCDKMESKHGVFYCPSKDEMEHMIDEMYEKFEKDMDDDDHKDKKNKKDKCREDNCDDSLEDTRQRRRYSRRRGIKDLISIILLNELLGRRRRRRPHHGYGYGMY